MIKIVMGGVVGLSLGLMVLWWGLRKDPLNLGPKVSPYAPWIVPAEFHGKPANSTGTTAQSGNGSAANTQAKAPAANADGSFAGQPNSKGAANNTPKLTMDVGEPLPTLPDPFAPSSSEPEFPEKINIAADPIPTTPEENPTTAEANPAAEPAPESTEPPAETPNGKAKSKTKGKGKSKGKAAGTPGEAPEIDLTGLLENPPQTATDANPVSTPATEPAPENTAETTTPAASAADLAAAVTTTSDTLAKVEAATANSEPKEVRQQLFTELYLAVADGGRVLSHLDPADADVAEPLASFKELLDGLAKQAGKLSAFGHLGRTHLPERKAGEGFAFAGKVIEYKVAGSVFESTLDAGNGVTVQLVSLGNPQDFCEIGDQLLAAGRIVDEPAKNIRGYEGEADRIVLLGHAALAPKAE
jgi:hypothetical protein